MTEGVEPGLDRESWAQAALMDLGAKICVARQSAGMTQEALGEALGRTQTAVSYWEAGKRDPGVPDLLRVAVALGVSAGTLLPDTAPKADESALPEGVYGRVEMPGYRQDTGWIIEETRFGQQMAVVRDWEGRETAAVSIGPACRVVYLPTPMKRPDEQAAIEAAGGSDDYLWERE